MYNRAILSLGGNQGDRVELLSMAIREISRKNPVIKISSIYETEAWGSVAFGDFLNQVVVIETEFTPNKLLQYLQKIELKLGRERNQHWGNRTMDIDILYYEDKIITSEELTIPHPFIQDRSFVLVPLAEISSDYVHPILGKSSLELLKSCSDSSKVKIFLNSNL